MLANTPAKKRLLHVHASIGALCGLWLFVVCFSGSVALFVDELAPWYLGADTVDSGNRNINPARLDQLIDRLASEQSLSGKDFLVFPPNNQLPLRVIILRDKDNLVLQYDATSDQFVPSYIFPGPSHVLRDIHTNLLIPDAWGRYLVGASGIVMLVSIISGILIYRKIFKDLFTLRSGRSLRLLLTDTHNQLSVWLLPFHAILAFSGAIIGLRGLLVIVGAIGAYQGDTKALIADVTGPPPALSGELLEEAPRPSDFISQAQAHWASLQKPGYDAPHVSQLQFRGYGDRTGLVTTQTSLPGYISIGNTLTVTAASRDPVFASDSINGSFALRAMNFMTPIHYGNFSGISLKLVYSLFGIAMSAVVLSGLLLWLEKPGRSLRQQRILRCAVTGIGGGMIIATAALLTLGALSRNLSLALNQTYLVVYLLSWATGGVWIASRRNAWHHLAGLCQVLLAIVVLLDFLYLPQAAPLTRHWILSVDATLLAAIISLALLQSRQRLNVRTVSDSQR